jgi:hypothetical protein
MQIALKGATAEGPAVESDLTTLRGPDKVYCVAFVGTARALAHRFAAR